MLRIAESQFICNLADRFGGVKHSLLGEGNQFQLNVFLGRLSRLFFNQITKVVG